MNRKRIAVYAVLSVIPLLVALWIAGLDPNAILGNEVTTSNAYVTGNLLEASTPTGGEVSRLLAKVGDPVHQGQVVAYLTTSPQAGRALPFVPQVRSPGPGTIVHLSVLEGQMVGAGQSIATIADLKQLWVIAEVDEGSFYEVHPGQRADVYVTALNQTFQGEVSQLMPDLMAQRSGGSVAATGGSASQSSFGNEVPVRVDFSYGNQLVFPGMSANVTIYIH